MTFGRESERVTLLALAESARQGHGRIALLTGSAGIGKTDLARTVVSEWVSAGGAAIVGHAVDIVGNRVPFGPWRQALGGAEGTTSAPARQHLRTALRLLDRPVERESFLAAAAVWTAIVAAADRQPLCIVLDDAQWIDVSSLSLLAAGVLEVTRSQLLVLVASRGAELPTYAPVGVVLGESQRSGAMVHLNLADLDRESMAAMVRSWASANGRVDQILARADGNPFYALSLFRASEAEAEGDAIPEHLREILVAQVKAAGEHVLDIVRMVALAGEPMDLRVLSAALGSQELDVEERVFHGVRAGVLTLVKDRVRTGHDLIGDAMKHSTGPATTRSIHRSLAAAIERADREPHAAARRAAHWRLADEFAAAFTASVEAAAEASAEAAYHEQWQHLRSAVEAYQRAHPSAPPDPALYMDTAEAAYRAGQADDAVRLIERLLERKDGLNEHGLMLLVHLVRYRRAAGDGRGAKATARRAFDAMSDDNDVSTRAEVTGTYAAMLMASGDYTEALSLAKTAVELASSAPHDMRLRTVAGAAHTTAGVSAALIGDVEGGLRSLAAGLRIAHDTNDTEAQLRALNNRSFVLQAAGRQQLAAHDALDGLVLARQNHLDRGPSALLLANLVECLDWLGRWDEALGHAREGLQQSISPEIKAGLSATVAHILTFRDDLTGARTMCDLAETYASGSSMTGLHAQLSAIRADLQLVAGNPDIAVDTVLRALSDLQHSDEESEMLPLATRGMLALQVLRNVEASSSVRKKQNDISAYVERMVRPVDPSTHPQSADAAWLVTYEAARRSALGDSDAKAWRAAARRWDELRHPLLQARCLCIAAEADALVSKQRAAGQLSEALRLADDLGAHTIRSDIDALARRAHLPYDQPARAVPSANVPALTSRELQVLALLTHGETNRRIARALFITERTASVHVSNILRKLNSRNRGEAAAAAHKLRLIPRSEMWSDV